MPVLLHEENPTVTLYRQDRSRPGVQHNLPLDRIPVREPNLIDNQTDKPSRVNLPPSKH